jgi:tetratricopeptide (TPR) repeat protein
LADDAGQVSDDAASAVSDDDGSDSYSVCTQEAIACYQRVIEILDRSRCSSGSDISRSELYACTLARLADCYLLTNQFNRAVDHYERSLSHFRLAAVNLSPERRHAIALINAHVLGQIGTINFVLRNYIRAAAMYELSMMLRQHLGDATADNSADPAAQMVCLEAAWTKSMYGMTLAALNRDYQCVVWSLRAFAEYIRVLRGHIINVRPPVRRWFVIETLHALGSSYIQVENGLESAVHYLTLAKNLIRAAPDEEMDVQQAFKVTYQVARVRSATYAYNVIVNVGGPQSLHCDC